MINFKNLPLRIKIFLVSLCTIAFLLTSYFFNFNQQQKRNALTERSANNAQLMRYHLTADMMHDAVRSDCYTMIYVDGAEEYELAALNLKLHLSILDQNFALAQKQNPLPEIAEALEKANINMLRYKAIALLISNERAQHLSANPKHFEQISTEFNHLFTSAESEMSNISIAIDNDSKNIRAEKTEQASKYNTMELTLLLIFVSIIALSLWLLQHTIIKPIEQMQRTIQNIEEGENVFYSEIQQSDEVGAMSSSLSSVVASLNNIKKLAEQISEVRDNSSSDFHIFNNKGEIHGALMYIKQLLAQRTEQTAAALKDAKEKNDEAIAINEELQSSQEELMLNLNYVQQINNQLADKEKTIAEQSAYQQALLEGTEYTVISTYPNGIIKTFNAAAEKLLGYSAEEMIDKSSPAIFHDLQEVVARAAVLSSELQQDIQPGFDAFVAKSRLGAADSNEWTYIHRDGTRFPVLLSITTLRNEQQEIIGYLGTAMDLSAQKKQEAALRDSEEELQKFFDLALDFMCIANVNGTFEKMNSMFSKALGYAPNELQGQAFAQYIHPDDLEATFKVVESLSTGALLVNFINRYRCKNGAYITLLWSAAPDISTGKLYATARDVTEQKENERILLQNNQELSTLRYALDQLAIVATTDVKGNITTVNDKFSEISKYSKEELLGKNHRILNSGHHPKEFFIELWKTISSGEIWRNEVCNRDKFGKLYWVDTIIVPILSEDKKPEQYIAIRHDITARKKSEKLMFINLELQKEKDVAENSARVKSEFLANMSHEIRTPMNGFIGMIDLLEHNTHPTPLQMEYLETIKSSSKSLLTIINDILDLSKLEAGKSTLLLAPLNTQSTIHQIKELFKAKALEKKLNIQSECGEGLPDFILSDATRLTQVLSNFVSNAIKFTEKGSVTIKTEVIATYKSKIKIKFSVIDTGIGMKENELQSLFQAFNQLDSSSLKKYEGTGLGLAISKQIVELFNGEVGVESEFGKGSTFWFTIETESTENPLNNNNNNNNAALQKMHLKVLLVDDKSVNIIVARTMLMSLGCNVKTAKNGFEAVEAFAKEAFDVVLMDIQMPIMDGVQATKEIKSKYPSMTPIIALTANAMEGDREKYLSLGLDDYLSKPLELDTLREKLLEIKRK